MQTDTDLTTDEMADIAEMPDDTYVQRFIALFRSGRVTQADWIAAAQGVRYAGENGAGPLVAGIERKLLPSRKDSWGREAVG